MIHTFPNGFRMIYEKPENNITVSAIQVFCKVGSAMEPDNIRGVSHFIEHMCFKGTKKLPLAKDISKTYDEIGAYFNAVTEKSFTNYIVKCQDEYIKDCILVLADMMLNSQFKKSEFEKEKTVVIEENIRLEDDAYNVNYDLMCESIYDGTPYENAIDMISYHGKDTLQYDDVIAFYKTYYRPNNMVLSIVTHVPFFTVIEIVKHSDFGSIIKNFISPPCPIPSIYVNKQQGANYIITKRKGLNTTHLLIGFRTCSQYSSDKYALNILRNILGGYMNARLFSILREQNGLTYASGSDTSYYDILGDFNISAETDPDKILVNVGRGKGVLPLIIDIIKDLQKNGITPSELNIAKSNMRGSMAISQEKNDNACFSNGSKLLLYTDNEPIVSFYKNYDTFYKNITTRHINAVIQKYLVKTNMTVCIMGKRVPSIPQVKGICDDIR